MEIVAVDSMQVYRGMDIGTAKPTPAEQAAVPHHLIDLADPGEYFSVARFQSEAATVIAGIESRGHRALLVGGTGLYFHSVVDGYALPPGDEAVRAELEAQAGEEGGLARLMEELAVLDPVAAARILPDNTRRIVRALEVIKETGRPFSSFGPGVLQVHGHAAAGADGRAVDAPPGRGPADRGSHRGHDRGGVRRRGGPPGRPGPAACR